MIFVPRDVCRLTVTALLALVLALSLAVTPAQAVQDLDAEQQFIELINADRTESGLRKLAPVADVRDVALAWSHTMADNRVMEHNPSYSSQFCCWQGAAENVGWTTIGDMSSPGAVSAAVARLHQAFMDSPGHRKNLMNPGYDHIGLAIEMRADSCPNGLSNNCMWVTENFREWDGTRPAGGLSNPYDESGGRDPSGDTIDETTVSDEVHDGGFDGDVTTVERLGANGDSAIQISQARFAKRDARHAVLVRDDAFPDSLAGAPLSAQGPLLFTSSSSLDPAVRSELLRVLPPRSTVYLLGGEVALSPAVDRAIRDAGLAPVRLAGGTRVDTALVVADEVRRLYGDGGTAAIARAYGVAGDPNGPTGWVDSVTGGAWAASRNVPVLISPTAALPDPVKAWLDADQPTSTVLLGGPTALSDAVLTAVPGGTRVSGGDRTDTAAAITRQLWGITPNTNARQVIVIDGWARDGWRHGLAAAGLAADATAPVLLASSSAATQPTATTTLISTCSTPAVDLLLIGNLTDKLARTLSAFDGRAC